MEAQLRAYIGRNTILEDDGFYYNIIPIDAELSRSIEILEAIPQEDATTQQTTQEQL
jgi:carboxyl-terminal processing protease